MIANNRMSTTYSDSIHQFTRLLLLFVPQRHFQTLAALAVDCRVGDLPSFVPPDGGGGIEQSGIIESVNSMLLQSHQRQGYESTHVLTLARSAARAHAQARSL
jgi:hypothetical protein